MCYLMIGYTANLHQLMMMAIQHKMLTNLSCICLDRMLEVLETGLPSVQSRVIQKLEGNLTNQVNQFYLQDMLLTHCSIYLI